MPATALCINEVTHWYVRGATVLDRADLTVAAGDVVIVRGANGSAQSRPTQEPLRMTAPTWDNEPGIDVETIDLEVEFAAAERLTFFSDAVVAIAITLLALALPLPHGRTNAEVWQSLRAHRDAYLAFLISFAVIGTHWSAHHQVFRYLQRLGGRLRQWNMIWLLMMVITPFATRVLTGNGGFAVRFALYASVQVIAFLCFSQMVDQMARHRLLKKTTPPRLIVTSRWRTLAMLAAFLISIPVAFVTHWAYLCWIAPLVVVRGTRLVRARWGRLTTRP